ncbi:MAG: hypothetical protein RLP09_42860 [Sandaracinaceae bacterium]|nr:hypothetical protein [Myxococcales bacterium]
MSEDPEVKAPPRARRWLVPLIVFAVTAAVYVLVTGPRTEGPSPNNHFAHLAESWLNGELSVLGGRPPGFNDWACVDSETGEVCPPIAQHRAEPRYRWYVSFPPFPAAVLAPAVAIFGTDFSDPLIWALLAGLAPAFLYVLLRRLREEELSPRSPREDLSLVTVFAFGSVYFFTSVQGSVWFSAHVVASLLLVLFLYWSIGLKNPILAGLMLGLCFMTRPSTAPWALFFLLEAMRHFRRPEPRTLHDGASIWRRAWVWLLETDWRRVIKPCLLFAAPILAIGGVAMWMNAARFGSPFEFGHEFLMIRWRPRIEKWGLFNFHYFAKNLAVMLAAFPWLSALPPYVMISRHGLALWITSPNLVPALWPKKVSPLMVGLFIGTALVAILDLCYQNSGWVQFGYRFSLDYMPGLVVLLALSGRRFGVGFHLLLVFAIAVNTFGAITFDRAAVFYDDDGSQERIFQPD